MIVDFNFHPLTPERRVVNINAGAVVTQDVPLSPVEGVRSL